MAKCVISAKLPPLIDPTRTPLAYGNLALPRLNSELSDASLLLRQRALRSLTDHLHDPEHIVEAITVGIVTSLKQLLTETDDTVRQLTTEVLYIIASHASGRAALIEADIIRPLSALFDDSSDLARKNAHTVFRNVSESPDGAEAIVAAELIRTLVYKVKEELDEIKLLILDTLHFILRITTEVALATNAMEIFMTLLAYEEPDIRAKAARDIMDLSVPLDGKEKAVECGVIVPLVALLTDEIDDVRANAAGALMYITITTKGKYWALHFGALEPLVNLVDHAASEVRLNAIKALTCLSEAPEGRAELLNHIEMIRAHTVDEIPIVAKAATRAAEVITWLPGNAYYERAYLH